MRNIANKTKSSKKKKKKITQRKLIEQNLKKSEKKYRELFENAPNGISIIDSKGYIVDCNTVEQKLIGYDYQEMVGKHLTAFFSDGSKALFKQKFSILKNIGSVEAELILVRKDGEKVPTLRTVSAIYDDNGNFIGGIIHSRDITARKKVERRMRLLSFAIEQSNEGIAVIDLKGDVIFANNTFSDMHGYTSNELIGNHVSIVHTPDQMPYVDAANKQILEQGAFDGEIGHVRKDGSVFPSLMHNSLFRDDMDNPIGIIGTLIDITEQKKAELKLKESEEKYRYLFDHAQVGLYWSRISDGKFLECNETFAKLFGYDTREECLANYNAIEHYTDPKARNELLDEIRDNKEVRNYEIHVTKKDGTPIWVSISARAFEKEDRIEGAAIDITERKQAERELQLERDNFLNILNSMVDGVYIVDQNFNIEYVNPILTKEFGLFEGTKCFSYFEDRNEPCPRCKNKIVFQGKTIKGEWISFKNQKTFDVIDTPLKNLNGSISKLGIFRDISESKKAEQVLKESEEKYREAYNRAEFYKDLFAHDINNILQSILSGIQISQMIVDNPEKRDNLKENAAIIKEQVIRGAKLVSNVQKLSKLEEAGKNLEKIEFLNILENTISFVKNFYNDKKLAIRVDSIGEKIIIKANALLEDVFENLLINAIRHNTNLITEITVRISRERNVGKEFLKMEFMDNGIGVGDSMKEKIFQRCNNKDKGVYGMGLGLSLVRGIIESYNGKVWVEDRVKGDRSKGSNFVLVIPEVD